jgi:hypothetical protein
VLSERGREVLRQLYQAHLDTRGPGGAARPVEGAEGASAGTRRGCTSGACTRRMG